MAVNVVAAGGAAASSATGGARAGSMGLGALSTGATGASAADRHGHGTLGWLAGVGAIALVFVVLLPAILLTAIMPGGGAGVQIGAGSPIPAGLVPIFNAAGQDLDVNPYLLASVADQESTFGTGGSWTQVNSAGCVGFMQICIGGAGGDTWDETVHLISGPQQSVVVKDAYRLGQRPASYPLQTSGHPSYNDPFDAVMAAAVVLRDKVGGRPIPSLDATAYQAACGYYGACADSVANYAQTVISRARVWEGESALTSAPPELLDVPAGSAVQKLVALATQIGAMRLPYCWGGGHGANPGPSPGQYCHSTTNAHIFGDPEPGLDCSGAVRWLLVSAGLPDPGPISSGEMGSWLKPGAGRWVTVYYNADHTYMTIAGRPWGTSDSNYRGGAGWIQHPEPTGGYAVAHPSGL